MQKRKEKSPSKKEKKHHRAKKKRKSHPLSETELEEERNGLNLRSKEELVELLQQARRKISNSLSIQEEQDQEDVKKEIASHAEPSELKNI